MTGRFRKKKIYFTQVSNTALRDEKLSLKAKGLYAIIQSYITIEDFILYKNTLRKVCKEGEKAFESTWKELKDTGYLIQYKCRDKETNQFYYEYELLDEPEIKETEEEISQTPKREVVDNGGSGKGTPGERGVYNNTDLNNTDLNNTNISSSSKEESEVEDVISICTKNNYKLQRTKIKMLLKGYSKEDIIRAIITASSISNVKNKYAYVLSVLNNKDNAKVFNITKTKQNNNDIPVGSNASPFQNSYLEHTPYGGDIEKLEKKLLGWDS